MTKQGVCQTTSCVGVTYSLVVVKNEVEAEREEVRNRATQGGIGKSKRD